MRTSDEILNDAEDLIITEVLNDADFRKTRSSESCGATTKARTSLLPLLQEAAELRNINLLLEIEQTFLKAKLEHLVHTKESHESYNMAIRQIRAAFVMLNHVRIPDEYRWAKVYFTLPENITDSGLPKDEAHRFFASHQTRLRNLLKEPPEEEKAALLNARSSNVRLVRDIYMELQRQALAVSEVREPTKPYKSERKLRLAA